MKQDELVLSVRTKDLPEGALREGFNIAKVDKIVEHISKSFYFAPRSEAEYDFEAKQIIPYVVLMSDNTVLLVRRLPTQGEPRLHDKYSIGLGGHINPEGESFQEIIEKGMTRELNEELILHEPIEYTLAGILNDNSTEVSKVHLGLVYIAHVNAPKVEIREKDKMKGEFISIDKLNEYVDKMESWSQILVKHGLFSQHCE